MYVPEVRVCKIIVSLHIKSLLILPSHIIVVKYMRRQLHLLECNTMALYW